MTDDPDDRPVMSQIYDMVQMYRDKSGREAKYLRGPPDQHDIGALAAKEFGLTWIPDPEMPPDALVVTG